MKQGAEVRLWNPFAPGFASPPLLYYAVVSDEKRILEQSSSKSRLMRGGFHNDVEKVEGHFQATGPDRKRGSNSFSVVAIFSKAT